MKKIFILAIIALICVINNADAQNYIFYKFSHKRLEVKGLGAKFNEKNYDALRDEIRNKYKEVFNYYIMSCTQVFFLNTFKNCEEKRTCELYRYDLEDYVYNVYLYDSRFLPFKKMKFPNNKLTKDAYLMRIKKYNEIALEDLDTGEEIVLKSTRSAFKYIDLYDAFNFNNYYCDYDACFLLIIY